MKQKKLAFAGFLLSLTLTQGCTPLLIGGAAATTAAVAHDRRTTGAVVEDEAIELRIKSAISRIPGMSRQTHINVTSYNGIVLLSGQAPSESLHKTADTVARNTRKVKKVHNEITLAAPSAFMVRSSDTLITSKIKATQLGTIDPTRVKVVTESGVVYLMGILSRQEGDIATERARRVGGVQRVVKLFEYVD
ncbi:MAG: BON domain-containing protein [Gammaproteobacteria bacterium]